MWLRGKHLQNILISIFTCLCLKRPKWWHVWHYPMLDFKIIIASSLLCVKVKTNSEMEKLLSLAVCTMSMQSWQYYSSSETSSESTSKANKKVSLNLLPFAQDLGDTMLQFLCSIHKTLLMCIGLFLLSLSTCMYLNVALEQRCHLGFSCIGHLSIKHKEGGSGR